MALRASGNQPSLFSLSVEPTWRAVHSHFRHHHYHRHRHRPSLLLACGRSARLAFFTRFTGSAWVPSSNCKRVFSLASPCHVWLALQKMRLHMCICVSIYMGCCLFFVYCSLPMASEGIFIANFRRAYSLDWMWKLRSLGISALFFVMFWRPNDMYLFCWRSV